jgi:hypothetical protein
MRVELEWDFLFFSFIRIISTLLLRPCPLILPDIERERERERRSKERSWT